jgi:hypothetical protein
LPALRVVVKLAKLVPVTVLEFVDVVIVPFVVLEIIDQVDGLLQFPDVTEVTFAANKFKDENKINRNTKFFVADLIILVFIFYEF